MEAVADVTPMEAISNSWFFAGLFHDVGGCVEQTSDVISYLKRLVATFDDLSPRVIDTVNLSVEEYMKKSKQWLDEFHEPLVSMVTTAYKKSIEAGRPDQGAVGAIHLRNLIPEGQQLCYVREAGRAMSLHNMFPKLESDTSTVPISWQKEPLVCLLLLCDQLQTWDRETGAQALSDGDQPSRAELSDLQVDLKDGRPQITMSIDYIAPSHLDHSQELYARVKTKLTDVLRKNPYSALNKIEKPWPFALTVKCTLSGDPISSPMKFGRN
jgi:hypothetical protein